jgi:4-diphosphocytidyl-2-C-methyl-D-erythritol kinase
MNTEISVFAPAKINLFLEVTAKRTDGYHNLATMFAKLSLGDDIKITAQSAAQTSIELKVKGPFGTDLKADKTNLAYKAASAFFEHFNIKAACQIRLEKNIPLGAGLGGGSSDAGAVLRALCALFNIEINSKRKKDLASLAAKLGADVPVFLEDGTFYLAGGIGDVLTEVKSKISSPCVILVYPDVQSDTATAYKELTLNSEEEIKTHLTDLGKLTEALKEGAPMTQWQTFLYNKLEGSVLKRLQACAKAKKGMQSLGAYGTTMSGSGSCVFGLVDDKTAAEEMVKKLGTTYKTVFLTHFWRTKV